MAIRYDIMATVENWHELTRTETGSDCVTMKVCDVLVVCKPENSPNIENAIRICDWTRVKKKKNLRADPIPFII